MNMNDFATMDNRQDVLKRIFQWDKIYIHD